MSIVKVDPTTVTMHLLVNRRSACGTPAGQPGNWPINHYWVKTEMGYLVTCPRCASILKEIHAERKGA